ncbi:Smr/MutS family protein [Rhizobiaceae bacterium n13]|uniref:Smr/MutS family protein n=1 Tax=Ferirhizobium litorale TaxID=2927786 RepID=A0AAE3QHH9_9HYPH|nr:Smr/MutS family protein [Fererhizobium litorale]MDI7863039.1 Smr/MutS family protein [Fererhizobium litorale]MDI7923284.1 Smr/MutS family protein [Fererhizobium litorale]
MARKRDLSADERILWSKVARSARALPGRMEELQAFEQALEELAVAPDIDPQSQSAGRAHAARAESPTAKKSSGHHHPLEKPVKRKLSRGHLALDARIDLHGLIQSEAHGMLLDFLIRAHDRGLRHVLVITGKGSSMGSDGALKRSVPMWFSKAEFRYLISSYEPAAQRHGGEGALYVRLARHRKIAE